MRLAVRWRPLAALEDPHVMEVVTPRTNLATLTSAENLLAAIALPEPFALEIAADGSRRQFLVRAGSVHMRQQLHSQLGAAYPQADLRPVPPEADPAICRPGEQVAACTLGLRAAAYLPIKTFTDLDVDGERAAQADPVLGILSALGDLPAGWRGLSQLVLAPAAEDWCRDYVRLAVQHPLAHERVPRPGEMPLATLGFVSVLLLVAAVTLQSFMWIRAGEWLQLTGLATTLVVVLGLGLPRLRRLLRAPVYDMELVREKVTRFAYRAELRLAVFAPAT